MDERIKQDREFLLNYEWDAFAYCCIRHEENDQAGMVLNCYVEDEIPFIDVVLDADVFSLDPEEFLKRKITKMKLDDLLNQGWRVD